MSLSDKMRWGMNQPNHFIVEDVREAVKELKEILNKINPCYCDDMQENNEYLGFVKACDNCMTHKIIDEIFGEKLTA